MNYHEADSAIKRLSALDTYRRLEHEDVRAEYYQSLLGVEASVFTAAYAELKVTCNELPTIPALLNACKKLEGKPLIPITECKHCNGKGYIEVTERLSTIPRQPCQTQEEYEAAKKEYVMCYRCCCENAKRWLPVYKRKDGSQKEFASFTERFGGMR